MTEPGREIDVVAALAYEAWCGVRDPWWYPAWDTLSEDVKRAWRMGVLVIRAHDADRAVPQEPRRD